MSINTLHKGDDDDDDDDDDDNSVSVAAVMVVVRNEYLVVKNHVHKLRC